MKTEPDFRTNRDLFSNYYLDEHLPETGAWNDINEKTVRAVYDDIRRWWEHENRTVAECNESQLEERLIRPIFRKIGVPFGVKECSDRTRRRPDYGLFATEDAATVFERSEQDCYENVVAVASTKRWDCPLDTFGSDEHGRRIENPSYQMHMYLQETPARWAVLTNGKRWRLYHGPTSHRLDSYYEIDLPAVLERDNLEEFKYFYLFFRHEAFLEDADGDCFLDDVYDESNVFVQELKEDLQDNVYEAITVLSEGFLRYPDNDLGEDDIGLIHEGSIVYLYRLVFVLYAESRELLDTDSAIYEHSYSLDSLKRTVTAALDTGNPTYHDWQHSLQSRLNELFSLLDTGSKSHGFPEKELYIPAYEGELFRTDPTENDSRAVRFLSDYDVGDVYLARAIELLTRSQKNGERIFIDYSSFDVRHLGTIYERLLEYNPDIADEPLALDDGEYVRAEEGDDIVVREGEVYLTTDSGERKATGTYYTPEYVVKYIVENTLGSLLSDIREDVVAQSTHNDRDFAVEFAERVFDLNVVDPAMGSGHFLMSAVDYLAREIIAAHAEQPGRQEIETGTEKHDINWARRLVAQRCMYGVDLNPLAVELARMSLWLRTLAAEQPPARLDHRLKTGNALIGCDIERLTADEDAGSITTELRESDDITGIAKYNGAEKKTRRKRLTAMANVHTAEKIGREKPPNDAYERMAALEDDREWKQIKRTQWFQNAQSWAVEDGYFHWKLEYPEVFYDDRSERPDAGFDAVIGNPPYIRSRNLPDTHKRFYKDRYRSAEGAYDIYIPFLERAAELGDRNSFIIPNKWTTTDYGKRLRKLLLEEYGLRELVDVSRLDVFTDADIYPLVISYASSENADRQGLTVRHVEEPNDIDGTTPTPLSRDLIDRLGNRIIPVNMDPDFAPILEKALANHTRLGDHIEMTEAIHTGNVRDELVVDENIDDSCEKLADGTSIDRYHVEWSGEWIRYDADLIDDESGEYGDLRTRDVFEASEKLFIRDISYRPVAAYDDSQLFALNTLYSATRKECSNYSLKYLLAVFNSAFVDRYFRQVYGGTHIRGDYLRFKPMFSYDIPIPEPTGLSDEHEQRLMEYDSDIDVSSAVAGIEDVTDIIREAKNDKRELNSNIDDLLGEYSGGKTVSEIAGYQPPTGVSSSLLSHTTSSLEGLRVGSVAATDEGETLTISISARYKPEDEVETDRWGYTETDLLPAMEFVGLEQIERFLIREFVPYAIEKAGGFAGFRKNATKTNSLIDRMENITLPYVSDVREELDRYRERQQETKRLTERIETAEKLLDEIIYDLYGLTSDEKAVLQEND
ncbi:Eco57I restriction-modification methylase domain-containing protein [Halocatena salina]|uniref:site-specific DNA-methyltransferase (adenine-specific) n=1 Tax=Halocatena salina TaxID=2934340 RepID=A0A8U0A807_9EURY|nr:TaqI-like C-terminal specificity domain-containing protein [Halocatena salina]UPM45114.1 Eco57I restriction-modification methylase domain-containing protein [Halocatena salina]